MNWFSDKTKTIYPTKMFVNYLPETPIRRTKSISAIIPTLETMAIDMVVAIAPKIIDKGFEVISETINHLADGETFPTTVKRNFDTIPNQDFSLPSKITLVRGNFASNPEIKGEELFGDGETKSKNQAMLLDNKELHIEIDLIKSHDGSAVYLQPASYFYCGESSKGKQIDELVLAFAFLPAGEMQQLEFQNFLHFETLKPNEQYNFKSKSGYDNSFQSIWMKAPLSKNEPYTMIVQIQEIKTGNSFAKVLQTVYLENEQQLKTKLSTTVTEKVSTLKKNSD